jgi:hypothetical protein
MHNNYYLTALYSAMSTIAIILGSTFGGLIVITVIRLVIYAYLFFVHIVKIDQILTKYNSIAFIHDSLNQQDGKADSRVP